MTPLKNPVEYQPASKWLAKSVIGLVVGLMLINVVMAASVSHLGLRLQAKEQKAAQLAASIQKARQDLAASVSLTDLQVHARLMGFSSAVAYQVVTGAQTVAQLPSVYQN